jgi:hypothetical protein
VDPSNSRNGINYSNTELCWLNPFTRLLTENCRADQLEERLNSVTFVIFNYDRCVEHYLYYALQNYYNLNAMEVAKLLNSVQFYHPYGSVGALPWQNRKNVAAFGEELRPDALLENARQIKTFTEGTDPDASEICEIRESVATSSNLLFLGFAFHRLNMQLISPRTVDRDEASQKRTFATARGLSKSDCTAVEAKICRMRGSPKTKINMQLISPRTVDRDEASQKRTFATAYGLSEWDCTEVAAEICRMRGSPRTEVRNDLTCTAIFSEYTRGISLA